MITGNAETALEEAEAAQFRALLAPPGLRRQYQTIADHWHAIANGYKVAEKLSGYIEWRSQRLRDYP